MIIQFFLTALLAAIGLWIALQRTTSRLLRLGVLAVLAAGGYFVWLPEEANRVAQSLGVGRGADLLMYLWVVITLALIVLLYLKIVRLSRKLTELTRATALASATTPAEEDPQ